MTTAASSVLPSILRMDAFVDSAANEVGSPGKEGPDANVAHSSPFSN
jgi:hypothetical protein